MNCTRIAVSNSSPLILLAKTRLLNLLTYFYDSIFIPPAVHREVIEDGMAGVHVDAMLVKDLVDRNKIIVKSEFPRTLREKAMSSHNLHPGEWDALDLALSLQGSVVLLDDEEARKIARAVDLPVKGTLGLLVDYTRAGQIERASALKVLDELNKLMYLSGDVFRLVEKHLS